MNDSFKRVQSRGYSGFARVLTIAAMLLLTAATGAWAQTETYTVRMKKGTKDADKWTVTPAEATTTGVMKDTPVSLTYGGRLKVKDVAAKFAIIDLSEVTEDTSIEDGYTITGTLDGKTQPYKISIADGATVTLDGVTINGVNSESYKWAGLTCEGSATIILKHGSTNTVRGFHEDYPGILVPSGKTLIIKGEAAGTGALTASPFDGGGNYSYGAGIGGDYNSDCGNIEIQGGNITATGGYKAAGIGGGKEGACGTITISGGTITATGGIYAAGIGNGADGSSCDGITISGGNITAKGGDYAAGIGSGYYGSSCGDITISGGTITATGGNWAAGIGSGYDGASGDITISGGTITATGGMLAAGIGSGHSNGLPGDPISSCGTISITTGVTKVTATKGDIADNSIGAGKNSTCGKVTIGCTLDGGGNPVDGTEYWDGSGYQNGGNTYLQQDTITYEPSN